MDILRTAINFLSWAFFVFAGIFLISAIFSGGTIFLTAVVLAVVGAVLQVVLRLIKRR